MRHIRKFFRVYVNYLDVEAPLEPYEVKVSSTVFEWEGGDGNISLDPTCLSNNFNSDQPSPG